MAARLLRCPTRPVRSWTRSASGVKSPVRIGGASGFWGDSAIAAPQLLAPGTKLNYLVFDYLAETTLAIMSRMREKNPDAGYATDFVEITMKQIAPALKAGGVKVISNAGGINPLACKAALEEALKAVGVELKVGVVLGDEILDRSAALRDAGVREMFSDEIMPEVSSTNDFSTEALRAALVVLLPLLCCHTIAPLHCCTAAAAIIFC